MVHQQQSAHDKRELFLLKAEEAESHAAACTNSDAHQAWHKIAQSWRFLADQAVRFSRL